MGERGWVGSDTPSSSPFYGTKILCLGTLVRTPGLPMSEIRLLDGSFHSFIHVLITIRYSKSIVHSLLPMV